MASLVGLMCALIIKSMFCSKLSNNWASYSISALWWKKATTCSTQVKHTVSPSGHVEAEHDLMGILEQESEQAPSE